jgi:hypothetical protein
MGAGSKTKFRSAFGAQAIAVSALIMIQTSAAWAADPEPRPAHNAAYKALRPAGSQKIVPVDPVFWVRRDRQNAQARPVTLVVHVVSSGQYNRPKTLSSALLKRYRQGESRQQWYAMAGAGSGAIALMPGAPVESEGLRLQKRAKIGTAQLGLARDVGAGRVTLGYLHQQTGRDDLTPYQRRPKSQNLAALTLSIKR